MKAFDPSQDGEGKCSAHQDQGGTPGARIHWPLLQQSPFGWKSRT
jgi:hypothetical protein